MGKKILFIIGIVLIIWGIFAGIVMGKAAYDSYQEKEEGKTTDCYDKHGNKIIGVECEIGNEWIDLMIATLFLSIVFIGIGSVMINLNL